MTEEPQAQVGHRLAAAIELVGRHQGVVIDELLARDRGPHRVVRARQVAMYLAVVTFGLSQKEVAAVFLRGRWVVGHNLRVVEDLRDDPAFDAELCRLEHRLTVASNRAAGEDLRDLVIDRLSGRACERPTTATPAR